ncbi:hypothetical protein ACSLBF_04920 [Pseudoalteromonas sp. T1lg65]|uniref:hypothetical protein n=1 Tax=Pseudoalteromonas sp. T1lg65 TaxID=2077101 RepID=UPI003F7A11DF
MTILTDKSTSSAAGFVNGEFPNASSQLLPWPEATNFGTVLDVHGYLGGNFNHAIPNPYDNTGGYVHVTYGVVTYYNADGTIKWSKAASSMQDQSTFYAFPHIIHLIDGVPHLVGFMSNNANTNWFHLYKINLNTSAGLAGDYFLAEPKGFGILEDDTLFATTQAEKNMFTPLHSYKVELDDMSFGRLLNVGVTGRMRDVNRSEVFKQPGIALFNGSVTIGPVTGGARYTNEGSHDVFSFLIGINRDLSISTPSSEKENFRTEHGPSLNSFKGSLQQISKDLFMFNGRRESIAGQYIHWWFGYGRRMYFTRSALEDWIKNCIYAQCGHRIGG